MRCSRGPSWLAALTLLVAACTACGRRDASLGSGSPTADSHVPAAPPAFPLRTSANGRFLEDQRGIPFPILGRTAWFVVSLSQADLTAFLDDTVARGYDAIELHVIGHDPRGNDPPRDGSGDLPFRSRLDGAPWSGALAYADVNREAPDFTTPDGAYWSHVDDLLAACEQRGVLVLFFPAYVGANGEQGWMPELVANGPERIREYGAFVAARLAHRANVVWMMGGDSGTYREAATAVEAALIEGMKSVSGQASTHFSAEWDSDTICTDQPAFAAHCTLQGAYSWSGAVVEHARRGYATSPPLPTFLLEEPYDEEGPDGTGINPSATQPVRRFQLWGWLSGIAGYVSGNGYVWPFRAGWRDHLGTQGAQDMARLNALIRSLAWEKLVPSGLAGMRTLVPAGGGTLGGRDWVAAAADPGGTLLVAYVPPSGRASRTFTVDTSVMATAARARWWNPTSGAYVDVPGELRRGADVRLETPGDNGTGTNDWVLVLTPIAGAGAAAAGSGGR